MVTSLVVVTFRVLFGVRVQSTSSFNLHLEDAEPTESADFHNEKILVGSSLTIYAVFSTILRWPDNFAGPGHGLIYSL